MKYLLLFFALISLGTSQERKIGEKEVTASIIVRIIIPARAEQRKEVTKKELSSRDTLKLKEQDNHPAPTDSL